MIEIFNHDKTKSIKLDAVQVNHRMTREPMFYKRPNQVLPFSRDFGNLTSMFIITGILTGDRLKLKSDIENAVRNWWKIGTQRNRLVHLKWWKEYTGVITQCDFAELAGNVNEFDFTLEITEVQER